MTELHGVSVSKHLEAIVDEFTSQKSIYGYPQKKFYTGFDNFDFSVNFHGKKADNPLGIAAGPHSQLIQNIISSFLGGARIIELKTVQILDNLELSRPCIDMRNIGYNVEWSQELSLDNSYIEYVGAWVLLKIIEDMEIMGVPKGSSFYNTIFDISVGYDLKGISSPQLTNWIKKLKNAQEDINKILESLPEKFSKYKTLKIDPKIIDSVTISSFHGCPANEIESIAKYLMKECDLNVIVKMNPTILGYDYVKKTLNDDLGYKHIELEKNSFENELSLNSAVAMMKRLEEFAKENNKQFGAKFTNTLVVKNTENIFKDKLMYLSGSPLHVIAMNSMQEFRNKMGNDFKMSFSAGIDKTNFVDTVLCNIVPVSVCSDILKKGSYTRLYDYLLNLKIEMEKENCSNLQEFIIKKSDSSKIVSKLIENPKYHYNSNSSLPKKIDSNLSLFDCLSCNICVQVCPNSANFTIQTGKKLKKSTQICNLADFCNECGNCDTFCPEYGKPFVQKPRFFLSQETYLKYSNNNGFYFPNKNTLLGKIDNIEYSLQVLEDKIIFTSPKGEMIFDSESNLISNNTDDINNFSTMKILYDGIKSSPKNWATIILNG